MQKENLFEKVSLLKDKFKNFFQHRKKLAALENFAQAEPVAYKEELKLIKLCLNNRFLSPKGADFLNELLDEHHVNYLDWSHRTKWLKKEIAGRRRKVKEIQTTFFDAEGFGVPVDIPVEIINAASIQRSVRA